MEKSKLMRVAWVPQILLLLALARKGLGEPSILIEDQELPKKPVSRVKRNSETGSVSETALGGGGGGGMEMVGEEERSVVGCGEVLLTCPTTTMIVVSQHGGDLGETVFGGCLDLDGEKERSFFWSAQSIPHDHDCGQWGW